MDEIQETLRKSLSIRRLRTGNYPALHAVHLLAGVGAIALSARAWRRPRIALSVWCFLHLFISAAYWPAMGRYAAVLFPAFTAAALALADERWFQTTAYSSALLLALFSILYSHWYWVA